MMPEARLTITAALCLLLAGPAAAAEKPAADKPQHAPAEFTIHTAPVEDSKSVFATVESIRRTMARARIGGTVGALSVTEGDRVTAGQRIGLVGDPKLALQLQANDERMRSQQAQRDQAQADLKRAEQLYRVGSIAKSTLEQAQTALQVAERGVAALRAERAVTSQQMAEGAVLAPVTGRVLEVPVSIGSVVMPGETIAVVATENYILRAELPERHARFIKVGDTVVVGEHEPEEPLGLQGKALFRQPPRNGTVRKVYPEITNGRVMADIEVSGLNDYFVGERVRVLVSTGTRQSIVVPQDFLYRRFGLCFARLKDGGEVVVQPGRPAPGGIEVLAGLRDGDVVVAP